MDYKSFITPHLNQSNFIIAPEAGTQPLAKKDFYKQVFSYDHMEYTKTLYSLRVKYSSYPYALECKSETGYKVALNIALKIKRAFCHAAWKLKEPVAFHLTFWTPPACTSPKQALKAVLRKFKKKYGYNFLYVVALEMKPSGYTNTDKHREDGIHFQTCIITDGQYGDANAISNELTKLFEEQRGKTILDNERAVKITGGHYITRSKIQLLQGLKHLIGYIAKENTKPTQAKLKSILDKFGITERLRRFDSSKLLGLSEYEALLMA